MNDLSITKVSGCSRPDCPVNEGGSCIEDIEFTEDCENAILIEPKATLPKEEYRIVTPGKGLSLEDVATFRQEQIVPTVSIIGASASGKTTFLAMLFHRFLRSHEGFDNYSFMDSETFLALNEKLHYAEIKSKTLSVQMPRTSLEEEPAFHFKTKNAESKICESLWIDIPGEVMEQRLSKGTEGWEDYRGLARSTHVILFLDLSVISEPTKRAVHIEQGLDALAFSVQAKTWNRRRLMVVFSKADAYAEQSKTQINKKKKKIETRLSDDFESLSFCELHSLGEEPNSGSSLAQVWNWIHG